MVLWKEIKDLDLQKRRNMINAIINFTKQLLEDSSKNNNDIMDWNVSVEDGLYVFVDMDRNGKWKNMDLKKDIDYVLVGKNTESPLLYDCIKFNEASACVGGNKWGRFDKKKKINSCSPFAIAYNMEIKQGDIEKFGIDKDDSNKKSSAVNRKNKRKIISKCLSYYKEKSILNFGIDKEYKTCANKFLEAFDIIMDRIECLAEYQKLTSNKHFLKIFLRTIPADIQQNYYDNYISSDIFIDGKNRDYGVCGFMTTYNSDKPFLYHRTATFDEGKSFRISREDAECLRKFGLLLERNVLPNVLPVFVDKSEDNVNLNYDVAQIFNEKGSKLSYKEVISKLFTKHPQMNYLQNMYLLYRIRKSERNFTLEDFDFIPIFKFKLENCKIEDVITGEYSKKIEDVFMLEYYIACLFPRYKKETGQEDSFIIGHYFDSKIEDTFKIKNKIVFETSDLVIQSYYKYRHGIFDYIYKSISNSVTANSIDEMAIAAIVTDIRKDENYERRFSIIKKINIWFSLYNYFNNNKNNMASKVQSLKDRILLVADGKATLDTDTEFAFAAGQVVYYLLTKSAASNKSYELLEPYIQKQKSCMLQNLIAETITIYKHELMMSKGIKRTRFENLSANVLTYDTEINMRPLMKYFLAGCFSDCVMYKKQDELK